MDMPLLNMLLDGLMVLALVGLWWMWAQQAKQRKRVEILLEQATAELQESTRLLTLVMKKFPEVTQLEVKQESAPQPQNIADTTEAHIQRMNAQDKAATQNVAAIKAKLKSQTHINQNSPSDSTNFSAQIMRLQREGKDAQAIADTLAVPVAQVRLMLLLQAPKV